MCGFYFSTSACYCLSLPLLQFPPPFPFLLCLCSFLFFLLFFCCCLFFFLCLVLGIFRKNVSSFYEWEVRALISLLLSLSVSLSCLGSVHIKYVFPISVYLVFHFLFYACQINNGPTAATTIKQSSRSRATPKSDNNCELFPFKVS